MRYSPKPIEHYGRVHNGQHVGPAASSLLKDDVERWNLAFLSHDYDRERVPRDPMFTQLVAKTVSSRVDTGKLDILETLPTMSVRSLLRLPAPQFVRIMEHSPVLSQMPLYQARGDSWLTTIRERSWLCATHLDQAPDNVNVESLDDARRLLAAIAARR